MSLEFEEFWMKLMQAAERHACGNMTGPEGKLYLDAMWNDCESEKPANLDQWLKRVVLRDFRWVEKKPDWAGPPEWQFHAGRPMLFVRQMRIDREFSEIAGWGYDIFVFAGKDKLNDGWSSVIKTVTQVVVR